MHRAHLVRLTPAHDPFSNAGPMPRQFVTAGRTLACCRYPDQHCKQFQVSVARCWRYCSYSRQAIRPKTLDALSRRSDRCNTQFAPQHRLNS